MEHPLIHRAVVTPSKVSREPKPAARSIPFADPIDGLVGIVPISAQNHRKRFPWCCCREQSPPRSSPGGLRGHFYTGAVVFDDHADPLSGSETAITPSFRTKPTGLSLAVINAASL